MGKGRDRCDNSAGRDACGDGEFVRLQNKYRSTEKALAAAKDHEDVRRSMSEQSLARFEEASGELEAQRQTINEIVEELERCQDNEAASAFNKEWEHASVECAYMQARYNKAELEATADQRLYAEATSRRKQLEQDHERAKHKHDEYFVDRSALSGELAVTVDRRTGMTHVRNRDPKRPDLHVSFRSDGSQVASTSGSVAKYMVRETGATAD